ncbi:MAG: hypothetical protein RL215_2598, partial [Planctomycetota bacterium]
MQTSQHQTVPGSADKPPHPLLLGTVATAVLAFLTAFFQHPIQSTAFNRSDLWIQLADTLLGIEQPPGTNQPPAPAGAHFIPQRLPLILHASALLLAASLHGAAITRLCLTQLPLTTLEYFVLTLGSGLSILSLTTLLTGLAGWINPAALLAPLTLPLLALLRKSKSPPRTVPPLPQNTNETQPTDQRINPDARTLRWLKPAAITVLLPFTLYLLWGALTPQTDFDVREYHLQGPKEWFLQGRITCLPHNVYTSFPFLSEMLSLAGMIAASDWRSGALTGQLLLATFQPLTAAAVFAIARRSLGILPAWLALVIYLTTPWTLRISLIAYSEGALAFYLTASILLALAIRSQTLNPLPVRPLLLSGFLAASAMASKYTGLVIVVTPIATLWLLRLWQLRHAPLNNHSNQHTRPLPAAAAFTVGILVAVGPWLLRNWHDTGNPVYPLAWSIFGSSDWNAPLDARWKAAHSAPEHALTKIPQHILDAALRNTWTSPLLFGLAIPAAPFLWQRKPQLRPLLAIAAWILFTWWALTHRIDRFWIPAIPLLSIASASLWLLSPHRAWKTFLITACTLATTWNIRFCTTPLVGFHCGLMDLNAATQLVTRSDIALLNQQLPPHAKVLMVGEAEVFDARFQLLYNTVFDDNLFETLAAQPNHSPPGSPKPLRPASQFLDLCHRQQITHVLVNWSEILRYRLPGSYGYSEFVQPATFNQLVAQQALLAPVTLSSRSWDALSPAEQSEVLSWDAGQSLLHNQQFHSILLYTLPTDGQSAKNQSP